ELHAVADTPSVDTKEYLLPQHDGRSETVLLDSAVLLDGSALKSVRATHDQDDNPLIAITLTESGAKRFEELTSAFVGKRLGIVLAGQLQSAPTVQTPITGGSLLISGRFTKQEATEL